MFLVFRSRVFLMSFYFILTLLSFSVFDLKYAGKRCCFFRQDFFTSLFIQHLQIVLFECCLGGITLSRVSVNISSNLRKASCVDHCFNFWFSSLKLIIRLQFKRACILCCFSFNQFLPIYFCISVRVCDFFEDFVFSYYYTTEVCYGSFNNI